MTHTIVDFAEMKLNELASENLRGVFRIERLNQLNRKAMRDNATYNINYMRRNS